MQETVGLVSATLAVAYNLLRNALRHDGVRWRYTCDRYVLNTYLYLLLGVLVTATGTLLMPVMPVLPSAAVQVALSFGLFSSRDVVTKHALYLAFLMATAATLTPLYRSHSVSMHNAFAATLALFAFLVWTAHQMEDDMDDLHNSAAIGLWLLFLASMVPSHAVGVAVFSVFVLLDTRRVVANSKKCGFRQNNADYVNESMHLYLDALNLVLHLDANTPS